MATANGYKIISADSHASEPPDMFDRLPPDMRHRAPKIEVIEGRRWMIVDGTRWGMLDAPHELSEDEKRVEGRGRLDFGLVDPREGGVDIPLRLADQEADGVSAEVVYPNGTFFIYASQHADYQMAAARVLNDYYADIFAGYPDRFVCSATISVADIENAIQESRRAIDMGFRSLSVPVTTQGAPYNWPEYEPFWTAVEEMGIPISFHVFTDERAGHDAEIPRGLGDEKGSGEDLSGMAMGMTAAMSPLSQLIAAGVLERHPDLKFVLVECGIGWLAWFLYALDDLAEERHMWQVPRLQMKPSEYFLRQGHITFGNDPVGLLNRVFTGVDCLLWGSDYPHDEGTFPHSQEIIAETFKDLTAEEKRKIVRDNAAKLYGFKLN